MTLLEVAVRFCPTDLKTSETVVQYGEDTVLHGEGISCDKRV